MMNLSILDKILLILKYFMSSFLGIEMFLVVLLLFLFLVLNIKKNNSLVKIIIPIILVAIFLFISGGFHTYVVASIHYFIKKIMTYYYFPSIALYYIIILVVTVIFIYTILRDKMNQIKKVFNYILFSLIYVLFLGFSSYIIYHKMELLLDYSIYNDPLCLSFIQVSNVLFLLWGLVTVFYYLYFYFRKKFD